MNISEAIKLKEQIEKICKEYNLWYDLIIKHKPEPELIVFREIIIKINGNNTISV